MGQIYGNRRQKRINNNVPFVPAVYIYMYTHTLTRGMFGKEEVAT